MALTLITTPKSATANSYASEAEADAYNEAHVGGAVWFAATTETKKAALIMATRILDTYFAYDGWRTDRDQALAWPRGPLFNRDGITVDHDTIPQFMINATSELARRLVVVDLTADPDTKGFSEIGLGPITLKIDKKDAEREVLSEAVVAFISYYGRRVAGASSVVRLVRV